MNRLKTLFIIIIATLSVLEAGAQRRKGHFDAQKFQAQMEAFITHEAALSPMEASRFFPLFKEMQDKQRALFHQKKQYRYIDVEDNERCKEAIKAMDEIDVQIRILQQTYHVKFMEVLPAGKIMAILKAENAFHRQAFWSAAHRKGRH